MSTSRNTGIAFCSHTCLCKLQLGTFVRAHQRPRRPTDRSLTNAMFVPKASVASAPLQRNSRRRQRTASDEFGKPPRAKKPRPALRNDTSQSLSYEARRDTGEEPPIHSSLDAPFHSSLTKDESAPSGQTSLAIRGPNVPALRDQDPDGCLVLVSLNSRSSSQG